MKIIYFFLRRHCYIFDNKLFQLDIFKNNGWNVECWSAVNWTFDNVPKPLNIDEGEDCYYISNETDLIDNLERLSGQRCYFLIYPYDKTFCSWKIREKILDYGFKFANIAESLEVSLTTYKYPCAIKLPMAFIKELKKFVFSWLSFIKNLLLNRRQFFDVLKVWWLNSFGYFKLRSDLNFITTPIYYYCFPNLFESYSKRNIMIHSISYDEILAVKDADRLINEPYVVFIDQALASHSDFIKLGLKFPVIDFDSYNSNLSFLFDMIEKDFGCKVVIAAHPKAEYKGTEFSGRKIIFGKTNLLIRDALFVLIQTSTCFGVLTLLKKSFINIYDSVFFINLPSFKDKYTAIENIFHCKQLDIGDKKDVLNYKAYITQYNEHYDEYNEKYIISKQSIGNDKQFYETVEEIIKSRI